MNGNERLLGHSSGRPLPGQWGLGPVATQELGTCSRFSAPFIKTLPCPPPFHSSPCKFHFPVHFKASLLRLQTKHSGLSLSFPPEPSMGRALVPVYFILFPNLPPPFLHSIRAHLKAEYLLYTWAVALRTTQQDGGTACQVRGYRMEDGLTRGL